MKSTAGANRGVGGGFTGNKRLSEGIGSLGWLGIVRDREEGMGGGVVDNKTFHFSPFLFPSFAGKLLNGLLYSLSIPTSVFLSSDLSAFVVTSPSPLHSLRRNLK